MVYGPSFGRVVVRLNFHPPIPPPGPASSMIWCGGRAKGMPKKRGLIFFEVIFGISSGISCLKDFKKLLRSRKKEESMARGGGEVRMPLVRKKRLSIGKQKLTAKTIVSMNQAGIESRILYSISYLLFGHYGFCFYAFGL